MRSGIGEAKEISKHGINMVHELKGVAKSSGPLCGKANLLVHNL